ncbi:MAG: DNA helicase RecQ [Bdellovibrionaceae bacterium]|nr:DNA helicase RecQ [Pseudobdellovibrionaceae bacterium]
MEKKKQQILKEVFGFDSFRPLQESVVDSILNKKDILMILPTGGGKSLCYQLPALLMDGIVVVISPLLALMQDQVMALKAKGIKAAMISSLQDYKEIQTIEKQLKNQEIKLLFIAPERLQNLTFVHFLFQLKIAFFAVDEAHCVSEWGHEFRSDYRQLGLIKERFPDVSIAAFTATATKPVEKDIINQLQFKDKLVTRGPVYRDNLFINVIKRQKNGYDQLLPFLKNHANEQGIIYTFSRKNTEKLADFLQEKGLKAKAYHAGLSAKERTKVFKQFVIDDIDIIVATIAFGMGIDKSNVRFVVHMSMPKTLEGYYQEIGRAGRDGLNSEALLLYSTADLVLLGKFTAEIEDETYKQVAYKKLNIIKQYSYQESCRHKALSQYFGDEMQDCKIQCDNCLNPDNKRTDISVLSQMFLSAIYRVNQNFGQLHIIDILTGSKNQKVLNNNHDKLSVYNIGSETNKTKWRIIADRLLELEAFYVGVEFNTLQLNKLSMKIMKGEVKVDIRSSHFEGIKVITKKEKITSKTLDYTVDEKIYDELRTLRKSFADKIGMPAYIIFDNKALMEMAHFLPDTEEKFLKIKGVGKVKYEKYGKAFLDLLTNLK